MATRTIVFDLHDTLVDTAPDLIGSLKRLIERGVAVEGQTFTPAHFAAH